MKNFLEIIKLLVKIFGSILVFVLITFTLFLYNPDLFIEDIENILIYGPPGIGKYSQALLILKHYSPSKLKYEIILTREHCLFCIKGVTFYYHNNRTNNIIRILYM